MGKTTYSNGTTPTICVVGTGFSGLTAGIKLKTELGLTSFTIFDENDDVGGTWLVNTYPGCACDVESHLYSWSFELNPDWSHMFSGQKEIWQYMKKVAEKYGLYSYIKFKSQIKTLVWDETIKKWRVGVFNKETKNLQELVFDIVINGPGALRVPNIPKEFKSFKGPVLHTGAWDSNVEWENKVVAVVGSGSSAVQAIPELAKKAKELHCYQRKAAWVLPRRQREIPEFAKWLFAHIPFLMLLFRWLLFLRHELFYSAFRHESWLSSVATWFGLNHLKTQTPEDEFIRTKLTPNYTVGCKRVIISNEYYPTFQLSHVSLHTDSIVEALDNKIITADGRSQKIDVLVLGTGFTIHDYFSPMSITGKDSLDILTAWKTDGPRGYLGILSSYTPNQFGLIGPNTGLGHNSVLFMLECQMDFIIQLLAEMMKRDAVLVTPTLAAEEEFKESVETQMDKMVWGRSKCGSWYANDKGIITTLWPFTCINYWRKTRRPDFTKFDFS